MDYADTAYEKSLKCPTFDGTKSAFGVFWRLFKSYATVNGFGLAVSETPDPDLPASNSTVLDASVAADKLKIKARQRNNLACASFLVAFQTNPDLFAFIDKSVSTDWPEGQSHLIVSALIKAYLPTDLLSKSEFKRDLALVSMSVSDDPVLVLSRFAALETQYKCTMSTDEKLAKLLEIVPEVYKPVITAEQRSKGTSMSIADLEEALSLHFRTMQFGQNAITAGTGKEISLAVVDRKCNYCGKDGHTEQYCYKKKRDKGGGGGGDESKSSKKKRDQKAIQECNTSYKSETVER